MTNNDGLRNLLPMVEEQKHPDFAKRLNDLMTDRNVSVMDLTRLTGVTYEMVRRYTIGAAKPRVAVMQKLAHALGTDAPYLEYGVGEKTKEKREESASLSIDRNTYRVEVLDLTVSAGPGCFMISEFVEVLHAIEFTTEHARSLFGNRSQEDVKVMTVDGDSMCPTIQSGDRLFFDVSVRNFKVDGVYAFVFGQHFHVKRLQMQGLQLAVLSDNPAYKDWYVTEDTQDQLYIMGKALIHESIAYNKL